MSLIERKLIHQLKNLNIRPGSGNFKDYEEAKKFIRELANSPEEYQQMIRLATDFLRCQL